MKILDSSFRDPSGYVFQQEGQIFRVINKSYREHYDLLMSSGLYEALTQKKLLVPHKEVDDAIKSDEDVYVVIKPEKIDFISYPYEWCFTQLKEAALLTLKISKLAMDYGMVLKDASAYNIQFQNGRPIFIDTLSFEKYEPGRPWVAYRQFCQHFLAPLSLMSYCDVRFSLIARVFLDGVPLDLTSKLLPWRSWVRLTSLIHLHLHAKSQQYFADKVPTSKQRKGEVSRHSHEALLDNLTVGIKKLKWRPQGTEWVEYYQDDSYTEVAFKDKQKIIEKWLLELKPKQAWDLGSNTGVFSRLASQGGAHTISYDIDPAAVEKNYRLLRRNNEQRILPLVLDLTNPSPGLGFANQERDDIMQRGPVDLIMALALMHHLTISSNIPFKLTAQYFSKLGKYLIVEFVPREDPKVKKLLATREDIFDEYDPSKFEEVFQRYFDIINRQTIEDSKRILYLMQRKK